MKQDSNLLIYFKGLFMGVCDLVPGISGGTIALITGIYERLIFAIRNITLKNKFLFLRALFRRNKKQIKTLWKKQDATFLITLFAGIFTSIFLGAKLMSYLLDVYLVYVLSFFTGLILASAYSIYKHIDNHNFSNTVSSLFGFLIGLSLSFLSPMIISNPSFMYVFLGGFLAIFALFLPGISGSFILLLLGLYEYVISLVHNITTQYLKLLPFVIGAGLGVIVISRIVHFLFQKDKAKTLYTLLGLVLGSLSVPSLRIMQNITEQTSHSLLLFLFVLGIGIVVSLHKFSSSS